MSASDSTTIDRTRTLTVGDWTVEPSRNLLAGAGGERHVGPKVMDLLVLLAEHRGAVVPKERMVRRLWQGDAVTDEVVTTLVYALRRALGDQARDPRYVETVRGRGYRLIAAVEERSRSARVSRTARESRTGEAAETGSAFAMPHRRRWLAAAAISFLVMASAWTVVRRDRDDAASAARLSPRAEEAYALGRHFLDRGDPEALVKARHHLDRATREAPAFAPAKAALAEAWVETAPSLPPGGQADAFDRAREAAESALSVDASSPTAHRVLGWLAMQRDWDARAAEARFARVGLDAEGGERHLARFFSARGEHSAATLVGGRAVGAAPASTSARRSMAEIYYRARRYSEALEELDRVEELEGPSIESARLRADILGRIGHHSEALQACLRDIELSGETAIDATALDTAFAEGGLLGARRLLFTQLAGSSPRAADPLRLARLGAAAHARDASLDWLDQAVAERHAGVIWLGADPIYDPLRGNQRFRDLLSRIGL